MRGNARTQGELRRKEAGNVFGGGSRTPITITLLVKNTKKDKEKATIHYCDIGDYLNREDKLAVIKKFGFTGNSKIEWQTLSPNEHGDWISYRTEVFDTLIPIESEKKFDLKSQSFFCTHAIGVSTNRDAWVYNFSKSAIERNMISMITFYNAQKNEYAIESLKNDKLTPDSFIDVNPVKISWTVNLKKDLDRGINHVFLKKNLITAVYRPFLKQNLYWDKPFIERPGLSSSLFPTNSLNNLLISITGVGSNKDFTALISDRITSLDAIEKSQCFPLYYYEERKTDNPGLFDVPGESKYIKRDGVSDFILERARSMYGKTIGKEDIFYYVYGFLHSPQYRMQFANDLKKMLPRLPLVEDVRDFWKFSKAGRELADLHINYETVPAYDGVTVTGAESGFYTVEKMRFPKKDQTDTILYNSHITIQNIPAQAYGYVVNGKSAIEWIMERYQITTHKDSGIRNNPNDWATETGQPRYILDLLLSIINVSVKTVNIVNSLPQVTFE